MQAKMENMQVPWWGKMVVYWLENQVAITFYSDLAPTAKKQDIIASLHLDEFSKFLGMMGYKLSAFQAKDVRHVKQSDVPTRDKKSQDGDLNTPVGKYVFVHPSGQGSLVKCFFHVEQT